MGHMPFYGCIDAREGEEFTDWVPEGLFAPPREQTFTGIEPFLAHIISYLNHPRAGKQVTITPSASFDHNGSGPYTISARATSIHGGTTYTVATYAGESLTHQDRQEGIHLLEEAQDFLGDLELLLSGEPVTTRMNIPEGKLYLQKKDTAQTAA